MAAAELRVVCGPTAAGKSALALALAERVGATIVSADSRQVYRGFDIGTAKPTDDDRRRVPHAGVDVLAPEEPYSAAAWARDAEGWIAGARASGRVPIVVGGTGFYLRALLAPLFQAPSLDLVRRARLGVWLAARPLAELRRWCRALDPDRAHLGRTQLLRAVETALLLGTRLSALHRSHARAPTFTARYLVVDPGPDLQARIERRVDTMLAAGWVEEVRRLRTLVPAGAPAWHATGYRTIAALVAGTVPAQEARRQVIVETRQYAKRQRTWFRHQLPAARVARIDPRDDDALERAVAWWHGGAP